MLPLWYSPIYTNGLDPEVRFPRERYRLVHEELERQRPTAGIHWRTSGPLPIEFLDPVHDGGYVRKFLDGSLEDSLVRRIGLRPWGDRLVERTLVLTGGTVEATRSALLSGGCAGNLGGGTHHAYHDFGSGYCIFNDLAVAARMAQREFDVGSILVLDLDVHQGDGTAALFEDDPSVTTVSFHCASNFPFRKMRSDHDVGLPDGMGDRDYLERLESFLDRKLEGLRPELVLYQAGVDVLSSDRLGRLALSREGVKKRNEIVFDWVADRGLPLVLTMGGGYAEPLEDSVRAHADLFRGAAERFGGPLTSSTERVGPERARSPRGRRGNSRPGSDPRCDESLRT